jgi:predicted enzyme related to lactoylglutathione lyase
MAHVHININIDVDDLARAERFYCDAFQLRSARRLGADILELSGADVLLYLLRKPGGSKPFAGAMQARSYARHWSPLHLDFIVDDIEQAVTRAVAAGATLEAPPEQASYGTLARLSDPFGNGFCLLQFSAQGYDALVEREARAPRA